jgi:hypothetical protein
MVIPHPARKALMEVKGEVLLYVTLFVVAVGTWFALSSSPQLSVSSKLKAAITAACLFPTLRMHPHTPHIHATRASAHYICTIACGSPPHAHSQRRKMRTHAAHTRSPHTQPTHAAHTAHTHLHTRELAAHTRTHARTHTHAHTHTRARTHTSRTPLAHLSHTSRTLLAHLSPLAPLAHLSHTYRLSHLSHSHFIIVHTYSLSLFPFP